jgi:hypothetical protein
MSEGISEGEITQLLAGVRRGERGAEEALVRLVYAELRSIANTRLRNERPDHTLQTTDGQTATLGRLAITGVVDQDLAHGARGDGEEMGAALPFDALIPEQFDVGLVDQRRVPMDEAIAACDGGIADGIVAAALRQTFFGCCD